MTATLASTYPERDFVARGVDLSDPPALTLAEVCAEVREHAERAWNFAARAGETDEQLLAKLRLLSALVERYVWERTERFSEASLEELRGASALLSAAEDYLRSGAAQIQRELHPPSGADAAFVLKRQGVRRRRGSPHCAFVEPSVLKRLRLTAPGLPELDLGQFLLRCASLAHARRVLNSIGLSTTSTDVDGKPALRCRGELVTLFQTS